MSEFSQMISEYMAEKNITVPSLAHYCGMDRSYLYKIIRGKRTPSEKAVVEKIAEYLHMTPKEQSQLKEKWRIAQMGADVYYRRRSVFRFLNDFPFESNGQNHRVEFSASLKQEADRECREVPPGKENSEDSILISKNEIRARLLHLFLQTAKEQDGVIRMLLPPDQGILHLFSYLDDSAGIRVEHLFAFDSGSRQTVEGSSYNLDCMRNIIPLYTYSIDYRSYYYYGDPVGQNSMMNIYPYLILAGEEALLLTENLHTAMVVKDSKSIALLKHMFKERLNRSRPVAKKMKDPLDLLRSMMTAVLSQTGTGYSFQLIPCITPRLTMEMLQEHMLIPPEMAPMLAELYENYPRNSADLSAGSYVFTSLSGDGVRYFMETGRVAEYPYSLYTPLRMEERKKILREIIRNSEQNLVQYRMLRENMGSVRYGVDIFVCQNSGYMLFQNPKNKEMIFLDVLETSLLSAIYDYLETMDPDLFYTQEEMKAILTGILEEF